MTGWLNSWEKPTRSAPTCGNRPVWTIRAYRGPRAGTVLGMGEPLQVELDGPMAQVVRAAAEREGVTPEAYAVRAIVERMSAEDRAAVVQAATAYVNDIDIDVVAHLLAA